MNSLVEFLPTMDGVLVRCRFVRHEATQETYYSPWRRDSNPSQDNFKTLCQVITRYICCRVPIYISGTVRGFLAEKTTKVYRTGLEFDALVITVGDRAFVLVQLISNLLQQHTELLRMKKITAPWGREQRSTHFQERHG